MNEEYEIVSVEPADAPHGQDGSGWHRYVIGHGSNSVHGYRQGDLASVTLSVEGIVERMNERRFGKRGRVHLDMSSKPKKSSRG